MQRFLGGFSDGGYAVMRIVFAFLYWSHGVAWLFGAFGQQQAQVGTRFFTAGVIELICGTLIGIGLFTSWAAFIACGEMAVAYFIAHVPRGSIFPIENGGEITVAICFAFLYIAMRGSGPFSVDRLLAAKKAG